MIKPSLPQTEDEAHLLYVTRAAHHSFTSIKVCAASQRSVVFNPVGQNFTGTGGARAKLFTGLSPELPSLSVTTATVSP